MDTRKCINMWEQLMIDLEGLGRKPGAIITEIAAVPFNWNNKNIDAKDSFYRKISVESSLKAGLTVQANTLQWWSTQDLALIQNQFDPKGAIPLGQALFEFKVYLDSLHPSQLKVWGNSNRFDLGLLDAAYNAIGREIPWYFRHERDVRTLVDFYPEIKQNHIWKGTLHNPIDDCLNQIDYCVEIRSRLKRIV